MEHMDEVGIRALKQNASEVVAAAAAGQPVTVTHRGRPVAALVPLPDDSLTRLAAAGLARLATTDIATLPPPEPLSGDGESLTTAVLDERRTARY